MRCQVVKLTGGFPASGRTLHRQLLTLLWIGLQVLTCVSATRAEVLATANAEEEVKLDMKFDFNFMAHGSRWANDSLNDPRLFSTEPQNSGAVGYITSRTDLRVGKQVAGRLTATGRYRTGYPESGENLRLLEGWASYSNADQIQRIIVGKQKIKWSQDTTFHLLDVIGPANARRSSVGLNEYDVYQKEGTVAIRKMGSSHGLRWDLVLADAAANQVRPGNWQLAARLSSNLAGSDIGFLFERTRGYSVRSGLSFSRNLSEDLDIYIEALQAGEREIPVLEQVGAAIPVSPSLTLPALSRFADSLPKRETNQMLVSLRRNIEDFALTEVSYFYNGNGFGAGQWRDYLARLGTARSTYNQPEFLSFYPNAAANPNGAFLGDAAGRGAWMLMRRHYINLRIDTLENFTFGRLEANLVTGMEDGGSTVMLTLRRKLFDRVTLSPFVIGTFPPKGSESGTIPYSITFGFGLHSSF